jgi:hypothetical protein
LNHDRVGHLIRVTPSYEKYKFTFAGALLCKEMFWDFFPVESVERTLPPLHASRDDKSNLAIRYLGRKLGLPIEEWSMSHRPSQTEYDSFFGSYGSFEKEIAASAFLGDPELTTDLKEGACERMAAQSRMRLSQ